MAWAQSGKTEVLWLGQATTRITTPGGKVIVIDPWLSSNPKTPAAFRALSAIGKVDLILVTHAHFDHFADAPALAKMHNAPVYGPAGMNQTITALGILPADWRALARRHIAPFVRWYEITRAGRAFVRAGLE